jgi:uncharacterized protein YrrD
MKGVHQVMKKTQEILGLPIISISDGTEIGKVKSIIINADKGAIDYIVVDSGIQILSARVIPSDSILGIGEYALTVENEGSINDISKIPAAIDLLQRNIQVKGTKVLTKKGRLIGEIGDIYVDEDDCCKIIGLEYIADITQKKIRIIPRDNVITFGKNLVVVTEDIEGALLESAAQLGSVEFDTELEKKNLVISAFEGAELTKADEFEPEPVNEFNEFVQKSDNFIASEGSSFYNEIENEEPVKEDVMEFNEPIEEGSLVKEDFENEDSTDEENITEESVEEIEPLNFFSQDEQAEEEQIEEEQIEEAAFGSPDLDETHIMEENEEANEEQVAVEEFVLEAPVEELLEAVEEAAEPEEKEKVQQPAIQDNSAASLFEQKQRQYLKGRKATKTITDSEGNTIVSEGMIINDELIDVAKSKGKLIELVMNNKA